MFLQVSPPFDTMHLLPHSNSVFISTLTSKLSLQSFYSSQTIDLHASCVLITFTSVQLLCSRKSFYGNYFSFKSLNKYLYCFSFRSLSQKILTHCYRRCPCWSKVMTVPSWTATSSLPPWQRKS